MSKNTNGKSNGTPNPQPRAKSSGSAPAPRDAIALLKAEHIEARAALGELAESTERAVSKRQKILAEVGPALWIHMQMEEDLFYPAFERALQKADDEVMSFEARAEHQSAKGALSRLEACDPASTEFRAMAKVVKDLVEHHSKEEETEMFPRVRELLDKDELLALGGRMAALKDQLMESGAFRRDENARRQAKPQASDGAAVPHF